MRGMTVTPQDYPVKQKGSPKKDAVIAEMKEKTAELQKSSYELVKSPVIAEFLGFKNEDT